MPGEVVGNNQNQGIETNNANAWAQMASEMSQGVDAGEVAETKGAESMSSSAETYWRELADAKRENGVELGEMPSLTKVDRAIANFFENGITGVTGKAREVREEMAQKAVLSDLAKLKERGGELNDETMQNVFYGTQRMLEEMYRGNRELREDAQDEQLSPDEEIAWKLKMDPRKAKLNVLIVMQQHTRRVGETDEAYEARLRNYAEDTLEHQRQLEADKVYNAEHPDEAAEYATQVLKNQQNDDLPEFKYLAWDETDGDTKTEETAGVEKPVDREGKIKQLFERVRGRIGFRKVVDKVMMKVAGAMVGAMTWAEGVLAEGQNEEAGKVEKVEQIESNNVEQDTGNEMERNERLKSLRLAKKEAERRIMESQGNSERMLKAAQWLVRINAAIEALETEDEAEAVAA